MRQRPIRAKIYLPVIKLGLVASDWKWVGLATLAAFMITFPFKWKIGPAPVSLLAALVALGASYLTLFYTRVGRPARWLEHNLKAWRESPIRRRHLPIDRPLGGYRPWIISDEGPE